MSAEARILHGENPGVLIASSSASARQSIIEQLPTAWLPVEEAVGGAEALGKLEASECRMLLLDRHLPDLNADELMMIVKARFPGVDVRTFTGDMAAAPAAWYLPAQRVERAATMALNQSNVERLEGMIGSAPEMEEVYRAVRRVAPRETTVLITGETGTGKELVAQAIHRLSPRSAKPLAVINCAAIPESLLESELFGYVRGAFTGAAQSRLGRIQSANGGTLFLDEIGEMPLALQAKLLRFLESGELQRLGSTETWRADVRVVAASNRNLREAEQSFRRDLYYRLCVFPIALPALRERRADIADLAHHFLREFAPQMRLATEALSRLQEYAWPGNVRELKHVIERATILCERSEIQAQDLNFDSTS